MSETVAEQLLLEHLKAIQSKLSPMADDIAGLQSDMRVIKSHMAGLLHSEVAQDGAIASMQARLDRLERHPELQD